MDANKRRQHDRARPIIRRLAQELRARKVPYRLSTHDDPAVLTKHTSIRVRSHCFVIRRKRHAGEPYSSTLIPVSEFLEAVHHVIEAETLGSAPKVATASSMPPSEDPGGFRQDT